MYIIKENILDLVKNYNLSDDELEMLAKLAGKEIYLHTNYSDPELYKISEYEKTQTFLIPKEFVEEISEFTDIPFIETHSKKIIIIWFSLFIILFSIWWISIPKLSKIEQIEILDKKVNEKIKKENEELNYILQLNNKIENINKEKLDSLNKMNIINNDIEELRKQKYLLTN